MLFQDRPQSEALHRAVLDVVARLGDVQSRASRSQVGFRRRRLFAATWVPAQYLKGDAAPLVLSVFLKRRDGSPRWKEVVEPAPGRFTHHLELQSVAEVDEFVAGMLQEAWREAG